MANVLVPQNGQVAGLLSEALPTLGSLPYQGQVTTPSNVATMLCSTVTAPLPDGNYNALVAVVARRISNSDGAAFFRQALVKVVAGVMTIIAQQDVVAALASGGFAPTIAYAVNGTNLEVQGTGVAGVPVIWQANMALSAV